MSHPDNTRDPNEEFSYHSEVSERPSTETGIEGIANAPYSRRNALKGVLGFGAMTALAATP